MEYTIKEYVGLRLETPLVATIDKIAAGMGITRSDLIRQTLREKFTPIDYATKPGVDAEIVNTKANLPYAK